MKSFNNIVISLITFLLTVFLSVCPDSLYGQTQDTLSRPTKEYQDSVILAWLKDLNEEGVRVENDSIIMSAETRRLLNDEQYREFMYPKTYKWEMVIEFVKRQELKKAFWFLINLYMVDDKSKEIVIKSLFVYDRLFKMDKILTNTFNTYILTDTEIGSIVDGQSQVTAPHIMEKKVNALKEILFYLDKYRPTDQKSEKNP